MSSLLTNTAAMTALQNLATTQKSLTTVQAQISSGLAVANASDNAAYWSISTSMKANTSSLSAVTSALNLGASVVSTATSAMSSVSTALNKMAADLVTAQTSGTDLSKVQSDVTAQQQVLRSIIGSASFNGVNLLDGSTGTTKIVSSFSQNSTGVTTGTLAIDTTNIILAGAGATAGGILGTTIGATTATGTAGSTTYTTASDGTQTASNGAYAADSILGFNLSGANSADLAKIATAINTAINNTTASASQLGSYSTTISNQLTFTSSLSEAITSGVGSLVDADMNVASTRLQALQTQQQLGIQALSVANQNSQLILKLFQG